MLSLYTQSRYNLHKCFEIIQDIRNIGINKMGVFIIEKMVKENV